MEKKISKLERKAQKEQMSNVVTSKMGIVFAALMLAIILLIRIGNFFVLSYSDGGVHNFTQVILAQIAAGVFTAAALVWFALSLKGKKDYRYRTLSPLFVLGLAVSALFGTLVYPLVGATATILSLIAFAVLFFVYEVYSVDCFICTATVFSGIISAMLIDNANFGIFKDILVLAVFAVILYACIYVTVKLVKNGKVKLGKKKIKKPQGMLTAAVAACIAMSVITVLGVLFLGNLLYFAAAAGVLYFIVAIIYTVRLM